MDTIDVIEKNHAYQNVLTVGSGLSFDEGEQVRQVNATFTINGEVVKYDEPNGKLYVAHSAATDGEYHDWTTTAALEGLTNSESVTPTQVGEDLQDGAQNSDFDTIGDGFVDFSESNPFGDTQ